MSSPASVASTTSASAASASASISVAASASAAPAVVPASDACAAAPRYSFEATGKYRRSRTKLLVLSQGDANHDARDAVVAVGAPATLTAKFVYGPVHKDLEGEDVVFFLRQADCSWANLGKVTTDGDGRASLDVPAATLSAPGRYPFEVVVEGDGSIAEGSVFVLAPKTRAVVFDVDATLTVGDEEIVDQVLTGTVPEMQVDADKIVRQWADAGWLVAYVTGRPRQLTKLTRAWLRDKGFPTGIVRLTSSAAEAVPSVEGVQTYKEHAIKELRDAGLDIGFAYGNAVTDICAYAHSGVDPKRTFIVGPHGGKACDGGAPTQALESYTQQLDDVAGLARP
ncbi:MAG: hypothetical protein U0271_41865 [Polyangiaceae bacterium]